MLSLYNLFEQVILESISRDSVMSALNNHKRVNITYQGTDGTHTGKRTIEVYAYGTTKSGHPVIRAYQIFGDSKSPENMPGWKFFRLDRISTWEEIDFTFYTPIHQRDRSAPEFREAQFGVGMDDTMDTVWATAKFDQSQKDNYEKKQRIQNGTTERQSSETFGDSEQIESDNGRSGDW